jgi:acrylyl-CoA reductase (NADPH)
MLCVMALEEQGVIPEHGPILVTGAAGGVGSIAIMILAGRGFEVHACTGRREESDYLRGLGAAAICDRAEFSSAGKPLQKETWAAVIDSVGSHTLANAIAQTMANGVVAACGLAQGMDLPATVAPFILRGVRLIGINSVTVPQERRAKAWQRLAQLLRPEQINQVATDITLAQTIQAAPELLAGRVRGRLVVDTNRS